MEEILASIRKIISEDQPEPAKPEPVKAEPVAAMAAPAPEPVYASEPEPVEDDVLELTEEVPEEVRPAFRAAPAQPMDDIAFATIHEPEPVEQKEESPAMDNDDLISDSTRNAVGRALGSLENTMPARSTAPASSGGNLDSLFTHAVQDALSPILQQWVAEHSGDIVNQLKPIIREWMDHNLPELIESAVKREIGRRR